MVYIISCVFTERYRLVNTIKQLAKARYIVQALTSNNMSLMPYLAMSVLLSLSTYLWER